ncbi:hypothetical protein VTK26DRAFT_8077 [Humicola hyalothermophila]
MGASANNLCMLSSCWKAGQPRTSLSPSGGALAMNSIGLGEDELTASHTFFRPSCKSKRYSTPLSPRNVSPTDMVLCRRGPTMRRGVVTRDVRGIKNTIDQRHNRIVNLFALSRNLLRDDKGARLRGSTTKTTHRRSEFTTFGGHHVRPWGCRQSASILSGCRSRLR